jgi:hypothetical protein
MNTRWNLTRGVNTETGEGVVALVFLCDDKEQMDFVFAELELTAVDIKRTFCDTDEWEEGKNV